MWIRYDETITISCNSSAGQVVQKGMHVCYNTNDNVCTNNKQLQCHVSVDLEVKAIRKRNIQPRIALESLFHDEIKEWNAHQAPRYSPPFGVSIIIIMFIIIILYWMGYIGRWKTYSYTQSLGAIIFDNKKNDELLTEHVVTSVVSLCLAILISVCLCQLLRKRQEQKSSTSIPKRSIPKTLTCQNQNYTPH